MRRNIKMKLSNTLKVFALSALVFTFAASILSAADTVVEETTLANLQNEINALNNSSFSGGNYIIEMPAGTYSGTVTISGFNYANMGENSQLIIRKKHDGTDDELIFSGEPTFEFSGDVHYVTLSNITVQGYSNNKYAAASGLDFFGGINVSNIVIDNVKFRGAGGSRVAIQFKHDTPNDGDVFRDITIKNSLFEKHKEVVIGFSDEDANEMRIDDLVISNCIFAFNTNEGNYASYNGAILGYVDGFQPLNNLRFVDNRVVSNATVTTTDKILYFSGGTNKLIARNLIAYNSNGIILKDEADSDSSSMKSASKVLSNRIVSNYTTQNQIVYQDTDDSEYAYFMYNLLAYNYSAESQYYSIGPSTAPYGYQYLYHNTFAYNSGGTEGVIDKDYNARLTIKNNIFLSNSSMGALSRGDNVTEISNYCEPSSLNGSLEFVVSGDAGLKTSDTSFSLLPSSKLIDRGEEISILHPTAAAYSGDGPDIGYYEYIKTRPTETAEGVSFTDNDNNTDQLWGNIHITNAADESGIDSYELWWSSHESSLSGVISLIGETIATGGDLTYSINKNTVPPSNAQYILVLSKSEDRMTNGVSCPIVDKMPPTVSFVSNVTNTMAGSVVVDMTIYFTQSNATEGLTLTHVTPDGSSNLVTYSPSFNSNTNLYSYSWTNISNVSSRLEGDNYFIVEASVADSEDISSSNVTLSMLIDNYTDSSFISGLTLLPTEVTNGGSSAFSIAASNAWTNYGVSMTNIKVEVSNVNLVSNYTIANLTPSISSFTNSYSNIVSSLGNIPVGQNYWLITIYDDNAQKIKTNLAFNCNLSSRDFVDTSSSDKVIADNASALDKRLSLSFNAPVISNISSIHLSNSSTNVAADIEFTSASACYADFALRGVSAGDFTLRIQDVLGNVVESTEAYLTLKDGGENLESAVTIEHFDGGASSGTEQTVARVVDDLGDTVDSVKASIFSVDGAYVADLTVELIGYERELKWNGLTSSGNRVPVGVYIIIIEIEKDGETEYIKKPIVYTE